MDSTYPNKIERNDILLAMDGLKPLILPPNRCPEFQFGKLKPNPFVDSIYKASGVEGIKKYYLKDGTRYFEFIAIDDNFWDVERILFQNNYFLINGCFGGEGRMMAEMYNCTDTF